MKCYGLAQRLFQKNQKIDQIKGLTYLVSNKQLNIRIPDLRQFDTEFVRYIANNLDKKRVGPMNIEAKKSVLTKRRNSLHNEVLDIQKEVVILLALLKKAEGELEEVQANLGKLEESSEIKLAYAS